MRLKNVILIFLLFFSVVLYAQRDFALTWDTEGLKGKVRSVTVFCDSIGLPLIEGETKNGVYRYEYDRQGRMKDAFFTKKRYKAKF